MHEKLEKLSDFETILYIYILDVLLGLDFFTHFIHKMSVTEKSSFNNHKFYDICAITLIY